MNARVSDSMRKYILSLWKTLVAGGAMILLVLLSMCLPSHLLGRVHQASTYADTQEQMSKCNRLEESETDVAEHVASCWLLQRKLVRWTCNRNTMIHHWIRTSALGLTQCKCPKIFVGLRPYPPLCNQGTHIGPSLVRLKRCAQAIRSFCTRPWSKRESHDSRD